MTNTNEADVSDSDDLPVVSQDESVQPLNLSENKPPHLIVDEQSELRPFSILSEILEGVREEVAEKTQVASDAPALSSNEGPAATASLTQNSISQVESSITASPAGRRIGWLSLVIAVIAITVSLVTLKETSDLRAQLTTLITPLATFQVEVASTEQPTATQNLSPPAPTPVEFEPLEATCQGMVRVTETQLLVNIGDYNSAILTLKMNQNVNVRAISSTNADWVRVYINREVYGWIPRGHIEIPSLCRLPEL